MEAAHTHPVVNVFIRLLAAMKNERKRNEMNKSQNVNLSTVGDDSGKNFLKTPFKYAYFCFKQRSFTSFTPQNIFVFTILFKGWEYLQAK